MNLLSRRRKLKQALEQIIGSEGKLYFQPPSNIRMSFPCIEYHRVGSNSDHADDLPYRVDPQYQVTVISTDPESEWVDKVSELPRCSYVRSYTSDNLYHDVFTIYP